MSIEKTLEKFQEKKSYDEHVISLEKHLENYFSDDEMTVFHEIVSLDFHLDVYFIKPSNRNYNILLTSGMSLLAMNVNEEIEDYADYQFAELMVLLPKDIVFSEVYTQNEPNSWIISMLKQTARFPHHYDTYIGIGHSIQADADMEPYSEETTFVGCIVLPSVSFDDDFTCFQSGDNVINIYSLFPVYQNELEYKIQHGYNAFVDLLRKNDTKEVINLGRKNLLDSTKI
jgi:Suppressor of fused protein (SUFU)